MTANNNLMDNRLQLDILGAINEMKNNYLFYFSRYLNKNMVSPDMIQIMLTSRCNLRCKMCTVWKNKRQVEEELSTAEAKYLIDQAIDMGIKMIYFTGGEALLREDLFELINYAARDGIVTTFNTNGVLITEEIAREIMESKLTCLTFSIDSPKEEIHDFLRGPGVFTRAKEAIYWINKYRGKGDRPYLGLCSVIMKQNVGDLLELENFAEDNGFHSIHFQPIVENSGLWEQTGDWQPSFWVDNDDLVTLMRQISNLESVKASGKSRPRIDILPEKVIKYFKREMRINTCFAGFSRVFVNQKGDISFVCFESFGNIKSEKLKDAWNSQKADEIRRRIKDCKLNCTQFCSERPESENLEIIHANFWNKIFAKFEPKICADLLEEENNFLLSFLPDINDRDSIRNEIIAISLRGKNE